MVVDNSSVGTPLDEHHAGWRQVVVDNSSVGTHTRSTSHWVEAGGS